MVVEASPQDVLRSDRRSETSRDTHNVPSQYPHPRFTSLPLFDAMYLIYAVWVKDMPLSCRLTVSSGGRVANLISHGDIRHAVNVTPCRARFRPSRSVCCVLSSCLLISTYLPWSISSNTQMAPQTVPCQVSCLRLCSSI